MSKKRAASIGETSAKPKPAKTKKHKKNEQHAKDHPKNDQVDFPRGGGIPLTPYQQAEARRDGTQQAEQSFQSSANHKTHPSKRTLSTSNTNSKKAKLNGDHHRVVESNRIEHLNSKRLLPGIKLAGIIIQIRPLALIVALPSNLLAHVPITEISYYYTKRLEENGEEDEKKSQNSSADSMDSETSAKGLNQIFSVGQWIRCSVLKSGSTAIQKNYQLSPSVRAAMKVTLTLDPAQVNSGVDKSYVNAGMTLTGAVRSIEDRGYILDFGIPIDQVTSQTSSSNLTAFVSFDQASQLKGTNDKDHSSSRWEIGQIIWCRINKLSENGSTCIVSVKPQDVSRSALTAVLNIDSILPLHMVSCQVSAVIPSRGLNVNFLGFFKGTIELSHLGMDGPEHINLAEKFQVGQKLSARVLWDTTPSKNHASFDDHESILGPKVFSLTLLDHIINLDIPGLPSELKSEDSTTERHKIDQIIQYPIGYIFQAVKIFRVEEAWGVYATCTNKVDGHPIDGASNGKLPIGYAHIAAIDDSFLLSLSETSGPYKIGSTHKARVVGVSPVDGCLKLSLQPSVIEQTFMCPEDVPVGAFLDVTVKDLAPAVLVVKIQDGIEGIVWPDHYSDVKLRHPEKKFIPGAKLKARVLYTNPEKNQVVLTLRKTLLNPDIEIITSFESARVGLITYGLVTQVAEKKMDISFFGRTKAVVPVSEVDEKFIESMKDLFSPGQLIKVKIVRVQRRRITASLKPSTLKTPTVLENGDPVSAVVNELGPNHVKLHLYQLGAEHSTSNPVKGLISLSVLAAQRGVSHDDLKSQLKKGDEIKDLTVNAEDKDKNVLIVGFKSKSASKRKPRSMELAVGDQVTGTIKFINPKYLVLHLRRDDQQTGALVEGFLSIASLAQKRKVSIHELNKQNLIGQEISGLQLTRQDEERGLLLVGFPDLQSNGSAAELDNFKPQSLSPSDRVVGRICEIRKTNIQLNLRKEGTEGYADNKGIISVKKVAKHRHLSEAELRSAIKRGEYIDDLMVLKKTEAKETTETNGVYLLGFCPDPRIPTAASSAKALSIGDSVTGTVLAIHEKNIVFSLQKDGRESKEAGDSVRGIMSSSVLAGHWRIDQKDIKTKLSEGQRLPKLIVNKMDPSRDLAILGFAHPSSALPPNLNNIKLSSSLQVRIIAKNADGLRVTPIDMPPSGWHFVIDHSDVTDDYDEKIRFEKGSTVSAVVVQIDQSLSKIYLSTRPSDLNKSSSTNSIKDPPIRTMKLAKGIPVRGFVQTISNKVGLILQVGTGIRGNVRLPKSSDRKFKVGQVLSTNFIEYKDKYLKLSLRPNSVQYRLEAGQTFDVVVTKVESYGMFLQVPKHQISGLCHSSQVYDDESDCKKKFKQDSLQKKFVEGLKLKASIHSWDPETKKLGFTIKPSIVDGRTLTDLKDVIVAQEAEPALQNTDESSEEDSDESSDEEPSNSGNLSAKAKPSKGTDQPPTVNIDFTEPSLPVSGGFAWNTNGTKQPDEAVSGDEESTEGNYFARNRVVSGSHVNGKAIEENKTIEQLEKSILETPDSAKPWIKLIDTHVQNTDISKARETVKRALDAIHYRQEDEKWKVWVRWLHLENLYGTDDQFSHTFNEAAVCNDSKTVFLKVADILSQSGKVEKAEEVYRKALKKFKTSCKVWYLYGEFCLKNNRPDEYADLLTRSLKSLDKRKHIKAMTKFARLEFKLGNPERGRTIFEGVLGSYPKRADLFKVYLDLEMNSGFTVQRIRGLFSRMMDLKVKNPSHTKSILKRWYSFEQAHGDKESQEMVITKAQSYVSSLITSSDSDKNQPAAVDHVHLVDDDDDDDDGGDDDDQV